MCYHGKDCSMSGGLDPTEEYDGRITVRLLWDHSPPEDVVCSSYYEAIDVVKSKQQSVTAIKIIDRDGDVVFTSAEMDIEQWETQWEHAKRSLSVNVEEYECPYDSISCFADDLCVRCKMDKIQNRY